MFGCISVNRREHPKVAAFHGQRPSPITSYKVGKVHWMCIWEQKIPLRNLLLLCRGAKAKKVHTKTVRLTSNQ